MGSGGSSDGHYVALTIILLFNQTPNPFKQAVSGMAEVISGVKPDIETEPK